MKTWKREDFHTHSCSEHPWYARLFFALLFCIIWPFSKIWTRWTIEGLELLRDIPADQGVIYVSNHSCAFDPAWIQAARPRRRRIRFMYKSEFDSSATVSTMLAWIGSFPVRRHTADRRALRCAQKALERGEDVGIFPEGTRIKGRLGRGKVHGGFAVIAHMAQAPIVPIAIEGAWRFSRAGKVRLKIGKPLFMEDYQHLERRERIELLEHKAMQAVWDMRDELDRRNRDYEGSNCG